MTRRKARPIIKVTIIALIAVAVLAYMVSTCSWFDGDPPPVPDPDVEAGRLVRLTHNDSTDRNPAWSPRGDKIAFECVNDGRGGIWPFSSAPSPGGNREVRNWPISSILPRYICVMNADGSGLIQLDTVESYGEGIVWSPDGSKIVSGGMNVVNADGSGRVRLTDSQGISSRAWSPDGRKIAFTSGGYGNKSVYVVNADGSSDARPITEGNVNAGQPTWSHDSSKIAFTSRPDDGDGSWIYVVNADGSDLTRITENTIWAPGPTWSPTEDRIAYTDREDRRFGLYLINADGSERTLLHGDSSPVQSPAWSPDGNRIAYTANISRNSGGSYDQIFVINVDGSGRERLTYRSTDNLEPTWSPDGNKLAFTSYHAGNWEIYAIVDFQTHFQRITDNDSSDYLPAWSPDGTRIAFTSGRDGDQEIYVMNADGSGVQQLTDNDQSDSSPAWSPHGTRIAYESTHSSQRSDIFVMNADGSDKIQLTNTTQQYYESPSWSPDGTRIAFVSESDGQFKRHIMAQDGTQMVTLDIEGCSSSASSWAPDSTRMAFDCRDAIHILNMSDGTLTSLDTCYHAASLPAWASSAAWSPDGNSIAFNCWESPTYNLYRINLGDNDVTQLTEDSYSHDIQPAWSPDSTKIAFASNRDGDYEIYILDLTRAP